MDWTRGSWRTCWRIWGSRVVSCQSPVARSQTSATQLEAWKWEPGHGKLGHIGMSLTYFPSPRAHPALNYASVQEAFAETKTELTGQKITSSFDLYSVETLRDRFGLRRGRELPTDVFVWGQGEPKDRTLTKVGGLPYWPAETPWPERNGKPLPFGGGLALTQLQHCDGHRLPVRQPRALAHVGIHREPAGLLHADDLGVELDGFLHIADHHPDGDGFRGELVGLGKAAGPEKGGGHEQQEQACG